IGAAVFIVLAIVATIMTSRGVNRDDAVGEIPGVEELTPTEVPAEGATEVPAEIPAEAAEVPTEAPAAATEAPTEAPATNG
ncbi:MAG: 30S ribosomal protein S2, partial [Clostridiales bacterium]|nr:30S ribosomal protein S2 [Clostridiales bacterium]